MILAKCSSRPGTHLRRVAVAGLTIVTLGALVASLPAAHAEQPQNDAAVTPCVDPITACGCTITKPGFYNVTNNLNAGSGLTPKGGCIDIQASKVVLNTGHLVAGPAIAGYSITGPGGGMPIGIGVHILKGSNSDFLELVSDLTGWDVGLLVEGNNNIVENFTAGPIGGPGNGTAGVEINGGNSNNLNNFVAQNNSNYGVWIRGASNNQFNCANTDGNFNIGTFVGCSATGIGGKCKPKAVAKRNKIYDFSSDSNTNFGIVIDKGNNGNSVSDTAAQSSGTFDMDDENPNCDHNLWFLNPFDTASQLCID